MLVLTALWTSGEPSEQQQDARRLADVRTDGTKNIYFIDNYIKGHLGETKTAQLLGLKTQIDQAIKKNDVEEITQRNATLRSYLKDNGLLDAYEAIVRNFLIPSPDGQPDQSKRAAGLGLSDKSKILLSGSLDDIVLLYNASPKAPSVWKNVRGDVVFQKDQASLCFAHIAPVPLVRFVERMISVQGAKDILSSRRLRCCEAAASAVDILAFQRGELLKQKDEYILALAKLMELDTFQQYKVLSDYATEFQKREALSLQVEDEVSRNVRIGSGVIKSGEAPIVCVVPPSISEQLGGLRDLLTETNIGLLRT